MKGRIHSYETMGLHDGPGIRTVFFLQGCPLRCLYCHNPDTQKIHGGNEMTSEEVVEIAKRFKPFYQRSGGGVTLSGGEPLLQVEFLQELLPKLKAEGISIALDTSGYVGLKESGISRRCSKPRRINGFSDSKESVDIKSPMVSPNTTLKTLIKNLLFYVDYLLIDIKHVDEEEHRKLTGVSMEEMQNFFKGTSGFRGSIWIRHVMIPGYTDNRDSMRALYRLIAPYHRKIEKVEILPYHKMGSEKYGKSGKKDPLYDVPPMNLDKARDHELFLKKLLGFKEEKRIG